MVIEQGRVEQSNRWRRHLQALAPFAAALALAGCSGGHRAPAAAESRTPMPTAENGSSAPSASAGPGASAQIGGATHYVALTPDLSGFLRPTVRA